MQWYILQHCRIATGRVAMGQAKESTCLAAFRGGAAVIGNEETIYGQRKGHYATAAAIDRIAHYHASRLRVDGVFSRLPIIVGDVSSRSHREDVGRYHDCAETEHAEDDEYNIHEGYSPKASPTEMCIMHANFAPFPLVLIIQVLAAC